MRIAIYILLLTFSAYMQLNAQAVLQPAPYASLSHESVQCAYAIPASMLEGGLKKYFKENGMGSGEKAKDGYTVYKGVNWKEILPEKSDVYMHVHAIDSGGRVTLFISRGYDNFLRMETDSLPLLRLQDFLQRFRRMAMQYWLTDSMNRQEERIHLLAKKQENMKKEESDLQKEKNKLEARLSQNTIETGNAKSVMENEQRALEQVRTKTATVENMKSLRKEVRRQERVTHKAIRHYNLSQLSGSHLQEALETNAKKTDALHEAALSLQENQERESRHLDSLKEELRRWRD